jgi:SnoaL-like domain
MHSLDITDPASLESFGSWAREPRAAALRALFLQIAPTVGPQATASACEASRSLGVKLGPRPNSIATLDHVHENEALARRFFEELCNGRSGDVADEIVAPDYVSHGPQAPPAEGPDGVCARIAVYQDALDGYWDIHEIHCAGDRVVVR